MEWKLKLRRIFVYIVFLSPIILQGCNTGYSPEWEPPSASHSLSFEKSKSSHVLWKKEIYTLNSALKKVPCVATQGVIVLVGSSNAQNQANILAFESSSGDEVWHIDIDNIGILANSEYGIFIADGVNLYLVEPKTGHIKWRKELLDIRNITSMMYVDGFLYINGTGIYSYYVIGSDGQVISKHTQLSDFYTHYSQIPFYPELPFGYVYGKDYFIEQRGDAIYSGYVSNRFTNELLWQIKKDSISNFEIYDNNVLWISVDSQIKIANGVSGNLIEAIEIDPKIDFFNPTDNIQHRGYYICSDNQSRMIYVILGDSRQIFALKFQN
jgi:hypothetical protein